jgi:3-(3-hydroxy-phenyl)propionate hydroxylase
MGAYVPPVYAYRACADQRATTPARHKIAIIGGGPVGLTAAIDLATRDIDVVLLDDDDTVSVGSRAICHAKRTLEIWDRLGCATPMMEKGVTWQTGKVFLGDRQVFAFDLLPEGGHHFPAFINLQQYYVEQYLIERAQELPRIDLRWKNRVVGVAPRNDCVRLQVETPDGNYEIDANWVIAADGARSPTRRMLGLEFRGRVFEDRFLIADVTMKADFPVERRFWFQPTFHAGGSALLHKQADDCWRIDLQLGWQADPEEERKPERILPRLKAMLGPDIEFGIGWASVYTFQCRRLERFRHGRVIFAGDSAHQLSPFGARGGNSGVQDADNLGWKLALVVTGQAPERLLDSYEAERVPAADENIRHSTRSTDFITPKGAASRWFRDAVLQLAETHDFARKLVNSGRLSVASILTDSPLSTPDSDAFATPLVPGAVAADAPVETQAGPDWLLARIGSGFALLVFADAPPATEAVRAYRAAADVLALTILILTRTPAAAPEGATLLVDRDGLASKRYDARPGTVYLCRPDQHIAARWRRPDPASVRAALRRATGH